MATAGSYPIRSFSESQTFLVLDPSTSTVSRVRGSDLIAFITPNLNVVRSESTTDGLVNEDYKIGSLVQTTGQSAIGDGLGGLFLVVASGEGDVPMLNGNDLLTIAGDAFLRDQLNNGIVRFGSLSDMEGTAGRFDGDAAYMVGRVTSGDGGEGNFRWDSSDLSSTLVLASVTSTSVDDTTDTITSAGHGLVDGDGVVSQSAVNGLSLNTVYWVVNATNDTFQLSSNPSGSIFDLVGTANFTLDRLLDPLKGIYVTATNDLTGVGGAWAREIKPAYTADEFGINGNSTDADDDSALLKSALDVCLRLGAWLDIGGFGKVYNLRNSWLFSDNTKVRASGAKIWRGTGHSGGTQQAGATIRNSDQASGNSGILMAGLWRFGDRNDGIAGTSEGKHIGFWEVSRSVFGDWQFEETYTFSTVLNTTRCIYGDVILKHQAGASSGHDGFHVRGGSDCVVGRIIGESGDDMLAFTDEGDGNSTDMKNWQIGAVIGKSNTASLVKLFLDASATTKIQGIKIGFVTGVAGSNGKAIRLANDTANQGDMSDIDISCGILDCSANDDNGLAVENCRRVVVRNPRINLSNFASVRVSDSLNIFIHNLDSNTPTTNHGVFIDNSENVQIIGGNNTGSPGNGILISDSTNCHVRGHRITAFASGFDGVRLTNTVRSKVTLNDIINVSEVSVQETGTSNKNIIKDNTIPGGSIVTIGGGTLASDNIA